MKHGCRRRGPSRPSAAERTGLTSDRPAEPDRQCSSPDVMTSPRLRERYMPLCCRSRASLAMDCPTQAIGALLFLSPRTEEWHVRKVFTKLGFRSRPATPKAPRVPYEAARWRIRRETLSIMVGGGDRSSGSDLPLHSYTEDVRGRRRATTRLTVALPDGRHISPRWSSVFHREADTWRFVSNARLDRSRTTPSADLPRVRPTLNNPTDERSTRV